ncbi:MAG: phosphomannomutase [Sphingomonas bacterium]|nr:phosphomannomutase [Sphingomonas bacterium]
MLYYAEATLEVDGGIQITGSHNPAEYNGFKMVLQHKPFFGEDIQDIGRLAEKGDWEEGQGTISNYEIMEDYVARLMVGYAGGAFKIGWDAGNGAAGPIVDRLVKLLPGEHHTIYTEVDGNFPNHHPDPTDEKNLADLKALVKEKGLDFGLAFDGDGDRIGAVDGAGRVIWGDQLLAILAEPVLRELPGATIIADVKASQALYDRIAELGGTPLMWKTGHSLIKTKMKETDSPLAGEMSGHIFFAHEYYGFDDAQYAAIRLIRAVRLLGGSLTALKDAMPVMVNTPEMRFQSSDDRKFKVVDEVLERLAASGADVNKTDGARVNTPDGWWLLRASNTQDVLVARAEAKDEAGLERLMGMINDQLTQSGVEPVLSAGH